MDRLTVFLVAVASATAATVLVLVRRRAMRAGYALLWLGVAVAAVLVVLLRPAIDALARAVGSTGPSLVFLVVSLFLLFLSVGLTIQLSRLDGKVERLAQAVALLGQPVGPSPGSSAAVVPEVLLPGPEPDVGDSRGPDAAT